MEEWEKHILNDDKTLTICGQEIHAFEWYFQSYEHASLHVKQEGRLVPCDDCNSLVMSDNEVTLPGV